MWGKPGDEQETYITPWPFHFLFELCLLPGIFNGSKAVIIPKFDEEECLQCIEKYKVRKLF
jgi:hypothetical protein